MDQQVDTLTHRFLHARVRRLARGASRTALDLTPTVHQLEFPDAGIAFWESGTGEPLLLVHGGLCADWFLPVARELQGYRVVRTHRAGYGRSRNLTGTLTVLDHARHCAEALRSLRIERAHVVGHSSGASVALQMAVTHPELVRSLVLIEPARPHAPDEPPVPAMPRAMNAVAGGRFDDGFDLFLRATCGPGYREAFVRQLGPDGLAEAMGSSAYFFGHDLPALSEWTFGIREIAAVRQPVLLVDGAESVYFTAAYSQRNRALACELPNADHVCVPGVTHAMPLQDPVAVARTIEGFVRRYPFTVRQTARR
ncbi:alpha/beta hydrolase [Pseudonocardia yunnanensis]|uniref:Alpha/beta fold hydrolase n=1 Tax=Pseudonocardia yunnanensis TaxID=58107 RepID=A0ABW4EPP7_9PSEU